MHDINKSFFGVKVLDDVSFEVKKGEIHALLGENGAGKSTLMNILAGVYTKDSGTVIFDDVELTKITIQDTEKAGIKFVHQELNIFNNLKVYENIFLNKELITKSRRLKKKEMINQARELLDDLGVDIDPNQLAGDLDTGKKQLLEIAKALHGEAKLIILDEPTTALNNKEISKLFEIIRKLKEAGKSFIFISHKMPEIFEIADRYTVLRNGKFINCGEIKDVTAEEVTRYMVGEGFKNSEMYQERSLGENVLELRNLSGKGFSNIDLAIRRGEIVGFTGLQGAGCSEVLKAIFGVDKITDGKLLVHGEEIISNNIQKAMKNGIAMVAANRKENSVLPDMTVLENQYVSEHALNPKKQHINKAKEVSKYKEYEQTLNIKTNSPDDIITSLSGGSQQKVILARWLNTKADIFLFDNPTQGIDVGSKSEIYKLILDLSKEGKTIIINTLEIPEIQKIADRCIVFYHGRIAAELERSEISEERVMLYATNAVYKEAIGGE